MSTDAHRPRNQPWPPRAHRPDTPRNERKAARRRQLLTTAAAQFAERGFTAVRLDDLGAAVGISGPAVYRHFESKEAVLSELLIGISKHLLEAGAEVVRSHAAGKPALHALIAFHVSFSLASPELIRIQDRDLYSLPDHQRRDVLHMQRRYVRLWVDNVRAANPDASEAVARTKVHALIGLLNSTPYSSKLLPLRESRSILETMAAGALNLTPTPTEKATECQKA